MKHKKFHERAETVPKEYNKCFQGTEKLLCPPHHHVFRHSNHWRWSSTSELVQTNACKFPVQALSTINAKQKCTVNHEGLNGWRKEWASNNIVCSLLNAFAVIYLNGQIHGLIRGSMMAHPYRPITYTQIMFLPLSAVAPRTLRPPPLA